MMSISLRITLLICLQILMCNVIDGFTWSARRLLGSALTRNSQLGARLGKTDAFTSNKAQGPKFLPGVDVPAEIACQNAIYDMVLVERISMPEQTQVGLFIPKTEGADRKHMGKVLSIPTSYGLESEQGRVQGINEIIDFQVGDVIVLKDPWGVGPKDQEVGNRCFSFHKAAHVVGVLRTGSSGAGKAAEERVDPRDKEIKAASSGIYF